MYNVTYGYGLKKSVLKSFGNEIVRDRDADEFDEANNPKFNSKINVSCFAEYIDNRTEMDRLLPYNLYYRIHAPREFFEEVVSWVNSVSVGVDITILSKKDGVGIMSSTSDGDVGDIYDYKYFSKKDLLNMHRDRKRSQQHADYYKKLMDRIREKKYVRVSEYILEIKIDDESEEVRSSKAAIEYIILVFLRMFSAYESNGSRASYAFKHMSEFNVVELILKTSSLRDNHSLVDFGYEVVGSRTPTIEEISRIFSAPFLAEIFKHFSDRQKTKIKQTRIMIEVHNALKKQEVEAAVKEAEKAPKKPRAQKNKKITTELK